MDAHLQSLDHTLKDELRQQYLRDLIQRSYVGIPIYPLLWWILATPRLWYVPTRQNFVWLGGIGVLMLALAGVRFLLLRRLRQRLSLKQVEDEWELSTGLMLCAGLWGFATALSLTATPLESLDTVMLAATAGICAGGIASLAISSRTVFLFLSCMLVPSIVITALGYSSQPIEFAAALMIFGGGMYWIAHLPREEYQAAQTSVIKLVHQAVHLHELAHLDSLTGLKNRRHFDELLQAELTCAVRHCRSLSLLLVDLDRFREINEQYGHSVGDDCLKAVAQALHSKLQQATDGVARCSGEEFAIILPDTAEAEARQIAEGILQTIADTKVCVGTETLNLSASVGGVSLVPSSESTRRSVLRGADDALDRAKSDGGHCIRFA